MKFILFFIALAVFLTGCAHRDGYGPVSKSAKFDASDGGYILLLAGYSGYPGLARDALNENSGWIKAIKINRTGDIIQKTLELEDKEDGYHPNVRYYLENKVDHLEITYKSKKGEMKRITLIINSSDSSILVKFAAS